MEKITAYKCEYCGGIFMTANRHRCKYDPRFKNCYSCEHNIEFYVENETEYLYNGAEIDVKHVAVNCDKGRMVFAKDISDNRQALQCPDHKYCGEKWHENGHAEYREKQFAEGDWQEF